MLRILGSEGRTLDFARQYLFWTVVIGGLPTVLNLVLANIVRAQGKAKVASIGMSVGGILNIILDPIFIFGFHMNVAGAALATCLSNTISMLYLLQHVVRNRTDSAVKLTLLPQKVSANSVKDILSIGSIGTPAALQILLASVSNSVMILANLLWPMYGLMLVQPFMESSGSMIALGLYRKQQRTHLITPRGKES